MATEKKIPSTQQPLANTDITQVNGAEVPEKKKVPVKKAKAEADALAEKTTEQTAPKKAAKKTTVKKKAEPLKPAEVLPGNATPIEEMAKQEPVTPVEPVKAEEKKPKKAAAKKISTEKEPAAKKAAPKKKAATKDAKTEIPENKITGEPAAKKSAKKTAAPKKSGIVKQEIPTVVKLTLQLRFHTKPGQNLYITGNHEAFGEGDINKALAMHYVHNDLWSAEIDLNTASVPKGGITYNYVLRFSDGILSYDWGSDKVILPGMLTTSQVFINDAWNHAGYYENVFYTEPFRNVLLKENHTPVTTEKPAKTTHLFKIKAPLLTKGQTVALTGSDASFGSWQKDSVILMDRQPFEDQFTVSVDLSGAGFPITYKYVVYDVETKQVVRYEGGADRILHDGTVAKGLHIINDGFIVLPNNTWKGAGVSVPVFSLRSKSSFGVGEFTDLKLLVDWAKKTGLKLVQILPVNDTTATHSWVDSYPYAAISAFALHPLYLNLSKLADAANLSLVEALEDERIRLNKLDTVDYETVTNLKWKLIQQLYPLQKDKTFTSRTYIDYFENNRHWLTPYAAFCYLKEKFGSPDFSK